MNKEQAEQFTEDKCAVLHKIAHEIQMEDWQLVDKLMDIYATVYGEFPGQMRDVVVRMKPDVGSDE